MKWHAIRVKMWIWWWADLPKMYDLYKSPPIYDSFKLLWFVKSISVNISGKQCKMPCLAAGNVSIVLLFGSFMLTTIVGTGSFPLSLVVCGVVSVVVLALMSCVFFLVFGIFGQNSDAAECVKWVSVCVVACVWIRGSPRAPIHCGMCAARCFAIDSASAANGWACKNVICSHTIWSIHSDEGVSV